MSIKSFLILLISIHFLNAQNINSLAGTSVHNADLYSGGQRQTLALFVINNDYPGAFEINFSFANSGQLLRGGSGAVLEFRELRLEGGSGQLGNNLSAPDIDILAALEAGSFTWDPGPSQSTPTENYTIRIVASWDSHPAALAGLYLERINAVIIPRN